MDACIQLLNTRIAQYQLNELVHDFKQLTPTQQVRQLQHLYQSGQRLGVKYAFMQNLAYRILAENSVPAEFIAQLTQLDELSFFTPALKLNNGFLTPAANGNNALHQFFYHSDEQALPFNYVRSLMLFESNEALISALAQGNQQGLTPVGCYIAFAEKLQLPTKHQFSALLALIEIEQKQNNQLKQNVLRYLSPATLNEPTLLLSAAYLQRSTHEVERLVAANR